MTAQRARILTIVLLLAAALSLVAARGLQLRQDYLTRGLPETLPGPINHAGVQPGLNVYLNQYDDAELEENLAQIAEMGIRTIKQPFYFSEDFAWDEADIWL